MTRPELAKAIYRVSHLTGRFRLRSGAESSEYFDKYRFESDPVLLREIVAAILPLIPPDTDTLAGLELGGVPVATVLAQLSGLPVVFVRKVAKEYGTRQMIEGTGVSGRTLLIVEDVVTSGGQVVLSAKDLRAAGATVQHAVCVVDRESGGREALAASGIDLHPLFGFAELRTAGELSAGQKRPVAG
jgi:orotate phosphoribosyltransferase